MTTQEITEIVRDFIEKSPIDTLPEWYRIVVLAVELVHHLKSLGLLITQD